MRTLTLFALVAMMPPAQAGAQPAPQAGAAAVQTSPPAPPVPAPPPAPLENYTYQPDGRRDPFLNVIGAGTDQGGTTIAGEGLAGLMTGDVSVRGVIESRGTLLALVQGPDNRAYVVHAGDKLQDGTVRTVTTEGIVVIQEVNDPLSLVKSREIHKRLRSLEDAK